MKINGTNDPKPLDLVNRATNASRAPASPQGNVPGVTPTDQVRLSATTQSLVGTDSAEPVDSAKVEEVRSAIQEGRFHVNAQVVADKMISAASELLETISVGGAGR
jgi:negative regulator of flagellin synthesis FlgM